MPSNNQNLMMKNIVKRKNGFNFYNL